MIAAEADTVNDYFPATTSLSEHLASSDVITFVGADHFMILDGGVSAQTRRFALAFFGLHLRGEEGFAKYLTEDFVNEVAAGLDESESYDTLIWGVPQVQD